MGDFHPIPKPKPKRKKKLYNGWKDKPRRMCYYCGTPYAERHEVFYGSSDRETSIRFGFQVDLCRRCHEAIHKKATTLWIERDLYWRRFYQKKFESKLISVGVTPEQARATWMSPKMIGKNYLNDDEVT